MRQMGLSALYPKPRTSQPGAGHKVYPYLLKGLSIERPNQVWASDICYIPMAQGFMYLVAILDWYSRRVLAWRVSNTFDSDFCVEALEDALIHYGPPAIFNTDQLDDDASVASRWPSTPRCSEHELVQTFQAVSLGRRSSRNDPFHRDNRSDPPESTIRHRRGPSTALGSRPVAPSAAMALVFRSSRCVVAGSAGAFYARWSYHPDT